MKFWYPRFANFSFREPCQRPPYAYPDTDLWQQIIETHHVQSSCKARDFYLIEQNQTSIEARWNQGVLSATANNKGTFRCISEHQQLISSFQQFAAGEVQLTSVGKRVGWQRHRASLSSEGTMNLVDTAVSTWCRQFTNKVYQLANLRSSFCGEICGPVGAWDRPGDEDDFTSSRD